MSTITPVPPHVVGGDDKPPSGKKLNALIVPVVLILALTLAVCAGYAWGSHYEAGSSNDPSNGHDHYAAYRDKSSYVGDIGRANLVHKTYYMPGEAFLTHTAGDEWFVGEDAPLLLSAADAGPYPYKVDIVSQPSSFMFTGGSGVQITLPTRLDFHSTGSNWEKWVEPPVVDLRDPLWHHEPVGVAVTAVLPAPGLKLEDYYFGGPWVKDLPAGQSAFIDAQDLKIVAGTTSGYIPNAEYITTPRPKLTYHYVRVTNTGQGLTVCTDIPERRQQEIYTMPADYIPLREQIPVKLAC